VRKRALSGNPPKQPKTHTNQQQAKAAGQATAPVQQPNAAHGQASQGCPGTQEARFDCNTVSAIANVRQADAAEWFNNLAVAEIGVGLLTAAVAFFAAKFARDAAAAGHKTLAAFVALERPRVLPSAMGAADDHGMIKVNLGVANLGKSSGAIHTIEYKRVDTPEWPTTKVARITLPTPKAIYGPGNTAFLESLATMSGDKVGPYVVGCVIYNSPFAENHRSYFGFHLEKVGEDKSACGWDATSFHKSKDWPKDT
jgi:hypothetical protein